MIPRLWRQTIKSVPSPRCCNALGITLGIAEPMTSRCSGRMYVGLPRRACLFGRCCGGAGPDGFGRTGIEAAFFLFGVLDRFSVFWKKIADGRVAIAHRGPRDVSEGVWSEGLRDTQITIRHARPDDRNGRRATVPLVTGRWSMVDGSSDQIAFDGLRGAGGNGSRLQEHRLRPLDGSPPSWSPRIRLTLYRAVAWRASLCIRDANLIFAGNAYPALTRTHLAKKLTLRS